MGIFGRDARSGEAFVSGMNSRVVRGFITDAGKTQLTAGIVLTVINNTATTPISGTFANLPDGSTFTVDPNTFHVSYEGGDGNDLTLTVVP